MQRRRQQQQHQQQSAPSLHKKRRSRGLWRNAEIRLTVLVVIMFLLLAGAGLVHEFYNGNSTSSNSNSSSSNSATTTRNAMQSGAAAAEANPHLYPEFPVLPIFAPILNARQLLDNTLHHNRPTMAGVMAVLQQYIDALHQTNQDLVTRFEEEKIVHNNNNNINADRDRQARTIMETYFDLTDLHLGALDRAYRGRPVFPVRQDGSIYVSLAAYREHLLADTLRAAFTYAAHPELLFVGVVVQNCFGRVRPDGTVDDTGLPCRTGAQVVGKNAQGKDMTRVSDAPADVNGIQVFCAMPDFAQYCGASGQIRVLYVHETESIGPAVARYYASKLWGGETYFMQCDAHLMFAAQWDDKYRAEIQATKNYPKSVLSSYPPGFQQGVQDTVKETAGSRLCVCMTYSQDPNPIVRINTGTDYTGNEPRPTQIPFIAAGFFFARAEFLVDVPFDPYMFWLFMGEEIALSMRAWTHGWDIYAPRKNLIAHQYRPGRMGLPKFWGAVNRLFPRAGGNNHLQAPVIKRIKHMVGYPDSTLGKIREEGIELVLKDIEHYGIGDERSWDEYMTFAHMKVNQETDSIVCTHNEWCNKGLKD